MAAAFLSAGGSDWGYVYYQSFLSSLGVLIMYSFVMSFFNGFTPAYDIQTILYFLIVVILVGVFYRFLYAIFKGFM